MKKNVFLPAAVFLSVACLSGCAKPSFLTKLTADESYLDYEFRRGTEEEADAGKFMGGQICHINENMLSSDLYALTYGQLKTLFGEADYETEDLENMYDYFVVATDKDGNESFIYAYCGPSGPAIGGDSLDENSVKAAKALAEKIKTMEPTDYDYTGYYYDFGLTVNMGVKDGKPYSSESGGDDEFGDLGDLSDSEDFGDYLEDVMKEVGDDTTSSGAVSAIDPDHTYYFGDDDFYTALDDFAGSYTYSSDANGLSGNLTISKSEDGYYNIDDNTDTNSYRFLSLDTDVEYIKDSKLYLKYPETVYADGHAFFTYYVIEKSDDCVLVYKGDNSYDDLQYLYKAYKD